MALRQTPSTKQHPQIHRLARAPIRITGTAESHSADMFSIRASLSAA
jgi:hypothetical protein